jgi:hypothetical protein
VRTIAGGAPAASGVAKIGESMRISLHSHSSGPGIIAFPYVLPIAFGGSFMPPAMNYQLPPRPQKIHPLALISMISGILAFLSCWQRWAAIPLAIVALIMGILAWRQLNDAGGSGKPLILVGIILGIIAIVLATIFYIVALAWNKTYEVRESHIQHVLQEQREAQQRAIEEEKRRQQLQQTQPASGPTSSVAPLEWHMMQNIPGTDRPARLLLIIEVNRT